MVECDSPRIIEGFDWKTVPFDPDNFEDENAEVVEMERQNDHCRSAADLLMVERARGWLLEG